MEVTRKIIVILYGTGGLSDVGRHCVQAALEVQGVECRVLTQHPKMLEESNWECGCLDSHHFTEEEKKRLDVIPVDSWDAEDLSSHFRGATAVISCLGNRQPFIGDWVAHEGNQAVIKGMTKNDVKRVVVLSSTGVEEDWPAIEWFWGGKILSAIFLTIGRTAFRDLTEMEKAYRASDTDFLIVRPV
jgi:uncharacterized protein YbjT (DUF2867 family)